MRTSSTSVVWVSAAATLVISLAAAGGACLWGHTSAVKSARAFESALAAEHQHMRDTYDAMRHEFSGMFPGAELPDHVLRRAARLAVRRSGPNAARGAQEEGRALLRTLSLASPNIPPQAQDDPELANKVLQILDRNASDVKEAEDRARDINVSYQAALSSGWTGYWMKRAGYPKNVAPPGTAAAPAPAAAPAAATPEAVPAPVPAAAAESPAPAAAQ